jgi:hypothetical protein
MFADSDFSAVVVEFTKAFEIELHQVLRPHFQDLQRIADQSPNFKKVSSFTIGQWLHLFGINKRGVEPLLRQRGLVYEDLCSACEKVNREKMAKHTATITKAKATGFRTLFLGSRSILAVLRPSR